MNSESNINSTGMLVTLNDNVTSIADCIDKSLNEGYIPTNKRMNRFYLSILAIDSFENIKIFNETRQNNILENINKILNCDE